MASGGGQIAFYATPADIRPLLKFVEAEGALVYVEAGNRAEPTFRTFERAAEIPNLGVADEWSGIECAAYLVAVASRGVQVRTPTGDDGATRHVVDELGNPDALTMRAAGRWGADLVLAGSVGSASGSDDAERLMKRFRAGFKKAGFETVKRYRVGPEALAMLKAGGRLTPSERAVKRSDLTLDE